MPHITGKRYFNKTAMSAACFSLINHVIQTHFSECKASWCRKAAQSGCSYLQSAAQSHFGKDGLQKKNIHRGQFIPSQAQQDVTVFGEGLGFASLSFALSLLYWEYR